MDGNWFIFRVAQQKRYWNLLSICMNACTQTHTLARSHARTGIDFCTYTHFVRYAWFIELNRFVDNFKNLGIVVYSRHSTIIIRVYIQFNPILIGIRYEKRKKRISMVYQPKCQSICTQLCEREWKRSTDRQTEWIKELSKELHTNLFVRTRIFKRTTTTTTTIPQIFNFLYVLTLTYTSRKLCCILSYFFSLSLSSIWRYNGFLSCKFQNEKVSGCWKWMYVCQYVKEIEKKLRTGEIMFKV